MGSEQMQKIYLDLEADWIWGNLNQEKVNWDTVRDVFVFFSEEHIKTIKDSMSFRGDWCVLKRRKI